MVKGKVVVAGGWAGVIPLLRLNVGTSGSASLSLGTRFLGSIVLHQDIYQLFQVYNIIYQVFYKASTRFLSSFNNDFIKIL